MILFAIDYADHRLREVLQDGVNVRIGNRLDGLRLVETRAASLQAADCLERHQHVVTDILFRYGPLHDTPNTINVCVDRRTRQAIGGKLPLKLLRATGDKLSRRTSPKRLQKRLRTSPTSVYSLVVAYSPGMLSRFP